MPQAWRIVSLLASTMIVSAAAPAAGGEGPPGLEAALARLDAAYPGTIKAREGGALVLADGVRVPIAEGRAGRPLEERLARPAVADMFALPYPAPGTPFAAPAEEADPGRIRVEPLFRAIYGDCRKGEVKAHMRRIAWVPRHKGGAVWFTTASGADRALERVSAELDRLPEKFTKYLRPVAGTYNCRTVAGTERLSMHAYGAAIDLNTAQADYWLWTQPDAAGRYAWTNRMPAEIVAAFERNGFVWGGRWYHFDTMHFEYRPELVGPAP